jgi:hypothetical protein
VYSKGHRSALAVVPANPATVAKGILERESVHSTVRVGLAIASWFFVLLILGPGMARSWHADAWSYEESVYFVFCTMSTIGFGDFYPNDRATEYATTAAAGDHPIQIYCEGVFVIAFSLGVFSFVYATMSDWWQERKEAGVINGTDDDADATINDDISSVEDPGP